MGTDLEHLFDALDSPSAADAAAARDGLAVALSGLSPAEAALLSSSQRARLSADLQFAVRHPWPVHRDHDYAQAVIGLMPLVGGPEDLAALEQLVATGRDAVLSAAASLSAERLRARLEREDRQGSLLRPAEDADSLLRPSDGTPRMLRAVHPPDEQA